MDLPPRARWAASTPSNPCGFGGNPLWAMRRLATSCVASGRHSEQVPALQVGTDVRFRPSTDEASSFGLEEGASGGFEEIPQPWIGGEHRFALVSDNQTYGDEEPSFTDSVPISVPIVDHLVMSQRQGR